MADDDGTIGLMIRRVEVYGTEYVRVEVMRRKANESHPIGMGCWWGIEGKPYFDGLRMGGHISDFGDRTFCPADFEYADQHSVDARKAAAMHKMLTKIHKQVEKDDAHEQGDKFVAFAKATGAQWVVRPVKGRVLGGSWSNTTWHFMSIPEGRNAYRSLISDAEYDVQQKAGLKAA
jgi:hypothetical protein